LIATAKEYLQDAGTDASGTKAGSDKEESDNTDE
jgi:hypothetical protein